jgi:hypothetical protein
MDQYPIRADRNAPRISRSTPLSGEDWADNRSRAFDVGIHAIALTDSKNHRPSPETWRILSAHHWHGFLIRLLARP